jgi:cytochrome c nitrite reductase small subunit
VRPADTAGQRAARFTLLSTQRLSTLRGVRARYVIVLGVAMGVLLGVGGYTFIYARGASYLTDDPTACVNCHVMRDQYSGWITSSHRSVAVCNDCHAPHDFFGKYTTKALNGFWHSFYFTTGGFTDPIRITGRNLRVTEGTCRECHQDLVRSMAPSRDGSSISCTSCHRDVGHLH